MPRSCSPTSSTGSACSSTPISRTKYPRRPRGRFRDLVRRRSEGAPVAYLVGRKEFYSLAFDGLAGRADPAARVGIRRGGVPRAGQGPGVAPRRGRRDGLRLPGDRRGQAQSRGQLRGDRHQRRGTGRRASKRRQARAWRSHRVPPGRPARPGPGRRALRRHRLEPAVYPDGRDPAARARRQGLRAPPGAGRRCRRPRHGPRTRRTVRLPAQARRPPDPRDRHRPGATRPRPRRGAGRTAAGARRSTTTPSIPASSARRVRSGAWQEGRSSGATRNSKIKPAAVWPGRCAALRGGCSMPPSAGLAAARSACGGCRRSRPRAWASRPRGRAVRC